MQKINFIAILFFSIATASAENTSAKSEPSSLPLSASSPAPSSKPSTSAVTSASASPASSPASDEGDDPHFKEKLTELLARTENSIKTIREQMTVSQSAPFLADLYLQLAELLTQKSTTLYYMQMEKLKASEIPLVEQQFLPVVNAQQEAIAVYRQVLRDFPEYASRKKALYEMAMALKSIDEALEFTKTASELIKNYPDSDEAMRARLLLGQHYFDLQVYPDALELLKPVADSKLIYESDLAKYRIGLIYLAQEKFKDALGQFEQVITDAKLKEQDNPYNLSLKKKVQKTDLKREALVDSIRAYTYAFPENPDPVTYYSKLAPTELYFQETIEKVALRYTTMQKYETALKVLRALAERIVDPQKVVNLYQEILLMIPIEKRSQIPVEEVRFVLDKYNLWFNYYKVSSEALASSYNFFEKQVRELGTSLHTRAKDEKDPVQKQHLLVMAAGFYKLYLGFFEKSVNSVRIASDLADVDFSLEDYLKSGDLYLQVFQGEFGAPEYKDLLISNALLCLQKKGNYSFYQNVRKKGLLLKALNEYVALKPQMKSDVQTNFLIVKTQYELGFLPEALDQIFVFIQKFPQTTQATDAGELILDYFNTRNDYKGLDYWANRMLSLKLPQPEFNAKLTNIRTQAKSKILYEQAKNKQGFDEFERGKSYLTVAMSSGDSAAASAALQQALVASKNEHDIQTFFKAANLLAEQEKDSQKKSDIMASVAKEYSKMTEYYKAIEVYQTILNEQKFSQATRQNALENILNLSLVLRDFARVKVFMNHPMASQVTPALKARLKEQLADVLDSPVAAPADVGSLLLSLDASDEILLSLFKAQFKIDDAARNKASVEIQRRCVSGGKQAVCQWSRLEQVDGQRDAFFSTLKSSPQKVEVMEGLGQQLMTILGAYQALEGSGDSSLEALLSLRESEVYQAFAQFLYNVGKANPDFQNVLTDKSKESLTSAGSYLERCKIISQKSASAFIGRKLCAQDLSNTIHSPSVTDFLKTTNLKTIPVAQADPTGAKVDPLQQTVFFAKDPNEYVLSLAKQYLDDGNFNHAAAASSFGISLYKDSEADYSAILGCAAVSMGFINEGFFHLRNASDYAGLKTKCMAQAEAAKEAL